MGKQHLGHILWTDLTVPNAVEVREFYEAVVGWSFSEVEMGGYSDFMMMGSSDRPTPNQDQASVVAGICHSQGPNAEMPAQWINYFGVEDLDASCSKVVELKGKILGETRSYGNSRYCVIEDPAGAVCGLFEKADEPG